MKKFITCFKQVFLIALITTFFSIQLQAQDVHFSQFYASPLTLNPALTGMFSGDARFAVNYRRQGGPWVTKNFYKMYAVSFETKILNGKEYFRNSGDVLAIGGYVLADRATLGSGMIQSELKTFGSIGYQKKLSDKDYLGFSVQAGFVDKRITGDPIYPSGHPCRYNPSSCPGYPQKWGYTDVNAGFIYYRLFEKGILKSFFAGGSAFHVLEPVETFVDVDWRIHRRYVGHLGGTIELAKNNWFLMPDFTWIQQGTTREILAGAYVMKGDLFPNVDIYGGARVRFMNAVYPAVGLQWGSWRFGANYDVTYIGSVRANNYRGAIEFALQYLPGLKKAEAKNNFFPRM